MNKALRDQVMSLPPEERAELAQDLWDSLAGHEIPPLTDEQLAEAERRLEAHRKDPSRATPSNEVMKRIQARFT